MTVGALRRGMALAVFLWLVPALGGCSGCQDDLLDRADEWLREDPKRPGKVGTLRALEVRQTAAQVAFAKQRRKTGPCEIGWRLDEPFSLTFSLDIEVSSGRGGPRRWREEGTWKRDEEGRWSIEVQARFREVEELASQRVHRVTFDEHGFREWLGPKVVAEYGAASEAQRFWKEEFGSRFPALIRLHSSKWSKTEEAERESRLWRPGDEKVWCGPLQPGEASEAWESLFEARTSVQDVEVLVSEDDRERCRQLRATHQLRGGGVMKIGLRECHSEGPTKVQSPPVEKTVPMERERDRLRVGETLVRWMDDQIVEPVDSFEE